MMKQFKKAWAVYLTLALLVVYALGGLLVPSSIERLMASEDIKQGHADSYQKFLNVVSESEENVPNELIPVIVKQVEHQTNLRWEDINAFASLQTTYAWVLFPLLFVHFSVVLEYLRRNQP